MGIILALIQEVLAIAPQAISAGIDVVNLIQKARAALDANAAPDDAQWQELDEKVRDLERLLNTDPPAG